MTTAYRAHPSANFSHIKQLDRSALHYEANVIHCAQDTLDKGSAVHCLTLEGPEAFEVRYTYYPGKTRRGKEWDVFREANEDRTVLSRADYAEAQAIAAAVIAHPVAAGLLARMTQAEAERYWADPVTGIECKAQLDGVLDCGAVLELKTTRDSHPDAFGRQFAAMKYHAQAAMYCDGQKTEDHHVIAVESVAPHDVVVYKTDPDTLREGRAVYKSWLARLIEIRKTKEYPGLAPDSVLSLSIPNWAFVEREEDPDGVTEGGYNVTTPGTVETH